MPDIKISAAAFLAAIFLAASAAAADDIAWDKIEEPQRNKLTAEQKDRVAANLNKLKNTRGCEGTIAACLAKGDRTAVHHAGFVVRMVRKKKTDAVIEKGIKQRADSAFPEEVMKPSLEDRPHVGKPEAPVVLVEYACFQCPYCAHLAPKLKKLKKRFKGKVVHYYKFFPVRSHSRGVATALAGVAAMKQGKFWEMYDLMYANRANLSDEDILDYAEKAGLDIIKFKADMKDPAVMKLIERDKLEGMRFGVDGTPTFFVNGKLFQGQNDYEEIADRVAEELEILEGKIE